MGRRDRRACEKCTWWVRSYRDTGIKEMRSADVGECRYNPPDSSNKLVRTSSDYWCRAFDISDEDYEE